MTLNLVSVFDFIGLTGFIAAMLIATSAIRDSSRVPRLARVLAIIAMGVMIFASLSNLIQSLGVTDALDPAEDLAEILLFPLVAYALYVIYTGETIEELRSTVRASVAQHSMLMSIVDSSPMAMVVVDDVGCVTFANKYAWDTLDLKECTGPT